MRIQVLDGGVLVFGVQLADNTDGRVSGLGVFGDLYGYFTTQPDRQMYVREKNQIAGRQDGQIHQIRLVVKILYVDVYLPDLNCRAL